MQDDLSPFSSEEDEPPSKTRRKQEMHALQGVGEQLVELNNARLNQLDLPESLRDAVVEARRIHARGALQRQMQYIGKLMRDVDAAPIKARLDEWSGESREQAAKFHRLESWRDRLLADDAALGDLVRDFPDMELQPLRALIRNARKEQAENKPPKSSRALFQMLRAGMLGE